MITLVLRVQTGDGPERSQYVFPNATDVRMVPDGETLTIDLTIGLHETAADKAAKEMAECPYWNGEKSLGGDHSNEDLLSTLKSLHWHIVEHTVNREVLVHLASTAIRQVRSLVRKAGKP